MRVRVGTGLEGPPKTRGKPQSTAERSNFVATADTVDPDLALIVARWPTLPDTTKAAILAMINEV
jgi:hypothetical protein